MEERENTEEFIVTASNGYDAQDLFETAIGKLLNRFGYWDNPRGNLKVTIEFQEDEVEDE
jgi:hypothetical protein